MRYILIFLLLSINCYSQSLINGNFFNLEFCWEFENSYLLIENVPREMTSPSLKIFESGIAIGTLTELKYGYYGINMTIFYTKIVNRENSGIKCYFNCLSGNSEILEPTQNYLLYPYNDENGNLIIKSLEKDLIIDDISIIYYGEYPPDHETMTPTEQITPSQTPYTITPTITKTPEITYTPIETITPTITDMPTIYVKKLIININPSIIDIEQTSIIKVEAINNLGNTINLYDYIDVTSSRGYIFKSLGIWVYHPDKDNIPYIDIINAKYENIIENSKIRVKKCNKQNNELNLHNPTGGKGPLRQSLISTILLKK